MYTLCHNLSSWWRTEMEKSALSRNELGLNIGISVSNGVVRWGNIFCVSNLKNFTDGARDKHQQHLRARERQPFLLPRLLQLRSVRTVRMKQKNKREAFKGVKKPWGGSLVGVKNLPRLCLGLLNLPASWAIPQYFLLFNVTQLHFD